MEFLERIIIFVSACFVIIIISTEAGDREIKLQETINSLQTELQQRDSLLMDHSRKLEVIWPEFQRAGVDE